MEAQHYSSHQGYLQCELCPRKCKIAPGSCGVCRTRKNISGVLVSLVYGKPCAVQLDPIEKKPLFHFYPGERTLSVATLGCNFFCSYCQNWSISQAKIEETANIVPANQIVEMAEHAGSRIISFTYTEPVVFFEYMLDIAKIAKTRGMKTVLVSNGYINPKPLLQLCENLDAANIDLKAFDDKFYSKMCKASLAPVLESIKLLKEQGVWLELTNLVIPNINDSEENISQMCQWISSNLGRDVPLHLSRFHPDYKMLEAEPTSLETLRRCLLIARKYLDYVYVGNVGDDNPTRCPGCQEFVVSRSHVVLSKVKQGLCPFCADKISGVWG